MRLEQGDRLGARTSAGAPLAAAERPDRGDGARVELDALGCPVALHEPASKPGGHRRDGSPLLVSVGTPVAQAAQRAMARPAERRFAPLVCIDDTGRYVGLVPLDAVVHHLTRTT